MKKLFLITAFLFALTIKAQNPTPFDNSIKVKNLASQTGTPDFAVFDTNKILKKQSWSSVFSAFQSSLPAWDLQSVLNSGGYAENLESSNTISFDLVNGGIGFSFGSHSNGVASHQMSSQYGHNLAYNSSLTGRAASFEIRNNGELLITQNDPSVSYYNALRFEDPTALIQTWVRNQSADGNYYLATENYVDDAIASIGGSSGTVTSITASSPLTGGTITTTGNIGIQDAAADNTTKGAASFHSPDFDSSAGNISIDYTNGQSASASTKGFLNSTDWNNFNNSTKYVIKDHTTSTGVNSTRVETILNSYLIPANTFSSDDTMNILSMRFKSGGLGGTITYRYYINTTNSLSGANLTLLGGFLQSTGTSVTSKISNKTYTISGGTIEGNFTVGSASNVDTGQSATALGSATYTVSSSYYFIVTAELGTSNTNNARLTECLIIH